MHILKGESSWHLRAAGPAPAASPAPAAGGMGMPGVPVRQQTSSTMLVSMAPFIVIFAIFYFLIIAPQRKQQKETDQMLAALKKGDRVVTSGGLHGTVTDFREADKAVVLEVAANVKVTVSRAAITSVKREAQLPTSAR
jgi:preprotein translocase subunit YajC